jgi:hypothetical protein
MSLSVLRSQNAVDGFLHERLLDRGERMIPVGLGLLVRSSLDGGDHRHKFRRILSGCHNGKTRLMGASLTLHRRIVAAVMANLVEYGASQQILRRDLGALVVELVVRPGSPR